MSRVRKIATAAGTFSVALGIGFVMQNGDALAARFGEGPQAGHPAQALPGEQAPAVAVIGQGESAPLATDAAVVTMAVEPPAAVQPDLTQVAVVAPAPAPLPEPAPLVQVARPANDDVLPAAPAALAAPAPDLAALPQVAPDTALASDAAPACDATMSAAPAAGAMAQLLLIAPCMPSQSVTIHHESLSFTAVTDDAGILSVTVPALAVDAAFIADLGDGTGAVAMIRLPEVAGVDRAILQWHDTDGLNLHAFENGAAFGEVGHVWQAAVAEPAETPRGMLTVLGDAAVEGALMAQVYTYPAGTSRATGQVELMVEAEVTAANCGREIAARALQLTPGADPLSFDLTMTMPGCDALGEFLVLPAMLMTQTLAAAN